MPTRTRVLGSAERTVATPQSREERTSDVCALTPAPPAAGEDSSDWERLVQPWQENGYGDEPPKCMGEYVDALEEALR